jgi:glycosyltransferase involved in cell wall biosynthesis
MNYLYKASIIITTFERLDMLEKVLVHLEKQKCEPGFRFEVIVVDDGSKDGTESIVKGFISSRRFSFDLRYLNTGLTEVYGLAVARNLGIKAAAGEHLLFLDDDVIPHWNWVAALTRELDQGANAVVACLSNDLRDCECAMPVQIVDPSMLRLKELSDHDKLTELLGGNCGIRRECFARGGYYDERFARREGYGYEDIEFAHRLLIGGSRIRFVPEAVAFTPQKVTAINEERTYKRKEAKRVWWHIIMHPQEGLPITPLLKEYAKRRSDELEKFRSQN